jgi:hypothetical protein
MFLVDCEHPSVRMKGLNSNLFWQIDTYCPKFIVFERDYSCLFRRILARRSGCRVNVGIGNEFFTVLCVLCNVMGIKLRTPKNPPPPTQLHPYPYTNPRPLSNPCIGTSVSRRDHDIRHYIINIKLSGLDTTHFGAAQPTRTALGDSENRFLICRS